MTEAIACFGVAPGIDRCLVPTNLVIASPASALLHRWLRAARSRSECDRRERDLDPRV